MIKKSIDISVLLATYKRPEILSKTLKGFCVLDTNHIAWEIIVVDNADHPGTKAVIKRYQKRLPIIYLVEMELGKNHALNTAIKHASGALYIFTDDDIIARQDWLQEMWKGAKKWKSCDVFGGSIKPKWPTGSSPIKGFEKDFFNCTFMNAQWEIPEGPYTAHKVWGPNMAVRGKVFDKGVKFDTERGPKGSNYIMGSETSLTIKLEREGHKAAYLPKAFVQHQIRQEQMKLSWIYGRAFRYGRTLFTLEKLKGVKLLFGAPRYLYRYMLNMQFRQFVAAATFNQKDKMNYGVKYWTTRGRIYQLQMNHNGKNNGNLTDGKITKPKKKKRDLDISVVIPTYKNAALIGQALESLVNQVDVSGINYEVIVVDNNSTDDTRKVINAYRPKFRGRLRYINESKRGRCFAKNKGIDISKGKIIACTDDDCVLDPRWISLIYKTFKKHDVDSVQGRIELGTKIPEDSSVPEEIANRHFARVNYGNRKLRIDAEDLVGANMCIKAEVFEKHGMYSSAQEHSANEDTEMSRRFSAHGLTKLYNPKILAYHHFKPQRLAEGELIKQAYYWGRSTVGTESNEPSPVRYFMHCMKRIILSTFAYIKARVNDDKKEIFLTKCQISSLWGRCYQIMIGSKK